MVPKDCPMTTEGRIGKEILFGIRGIGEEGLMNGDFLDRVEGREPA